MHNIGQPPRPTQDPLITEHGHGEEDNTTTLDDGISPLRYNDVHSTKYWGGQTMDNIRLSNNFRNSLMVAPSSLHRYIRYLPHIPPSTALPDDGCSSISNHGSVCIGQIFSMKQELQDKRDMMA